MQWRALMTVHPFRQFLRRFPFLGITAGNPNINSAFFSFNTHRFRTLLFCEQIYEISIRRQKTLRKNFPNSSTNH